MDHVFKFHGFLNSITISNFWQEFLANQGVQVQLSSNYNPQTDGVTSRSDITNLKIK